MCSAVATGLDELLTSKLHLVDLAGSERSKRSGASGTRLKEMVSVNQVGVGGVADVMMMMMMMMMLYEVWGLVKMMIQMRRRLRVLGFLQRDGQHEQALVVHAGMVVPIPCPCPCDIMPLAC